jgi:hypothetical protein
VKGLVLALRDPLRKGIGHATGCATLGTAGGEDADIDGVANAPSCPANHIE